MPEHLIYGWHEGWDIERLTGLFHSLKRQEIEQQRSMVVAVAIGASTLFGRNAYKRFMSESARILKSKPGDGVASVDREAVADGMQQLAAALGGGMAKMRAQALSEEDVAPSRGRNRNAGRQPGR